MSDSNRKFDISVGATYTGSGALKLATADIQKLREQASLPITGPLTKDQSATEAIAVQKALVAKVVNARAQAMADAGDRARIHEIANEQLFGKDNSETPQVKSRFSAQEQAVRDAMAKQIRAMRDAGREAQVLEVAQQRLFGAIKAGAKDSHHEAEGLLGAFEKFGLSNGPETLAKKLAAVAPKIAMIAAVGKAVSYELQFFNYLEDKSRHAKQGNLERQLADEQSANEFKESVFIAGPLVKGLADRFNIGGYHSDRVAIEELEDKTKAEEQHSAVLQKRNEIETELRKSGIANSDALKLQFSQHNTTGERSAVLEAQEQLRLTQKKIGDASNYKIPEELKEELELRKRAVEIANEDERKARVRSAENIGSEVNQTILKFDDRGRAAERESLRQSLADQLNDIKDAREKADRADLNKQKLKLFDRDTDREETTKRLDFESENLQVELKMKHEAREADFYAYQRSLDREIEQEKDATKKKQLESLKPGRLNLFHSQQLEDRDRELQELKLGAREAIARIEGRGFDAEIDRLQTERNLALSKEGDPKIRAAIENKYQADRKEAMVKDQREIKDADRDHKQSLLDAEADFASRRLRLAGQTTEAERLENKHVYVDRLAAIYKDEEAQLGVKGANSEAIKKRAVEDAAVAKEALNLSNEELDERKRQEFRPTRPGGISGETGILTGTAGAGATASIQEIVGANERTARAAEAQQKATQDLSGKMDELITAITTGAITIVRDK